MKREEIEARAALIAYEECSYHDCADCLRGVALQDWSTSCPARFTAMKVAIAIQEGVTAGLERAAEIWPYADYEIVPVPKGLDATSFGEGFRQGVDKLRTAIRAEKETG